MKKLKIMLLSFALLAIIGTALAFKARFSGKEFCTSATNGQSSNICDVIGQPGTKLLCPNFVNKTTINPNNGQGSAVVCTTVTAQGDDPCPNQCLTTTRLYND